MATQSPNLQSILDILKARPPSTTTYQQPGLPAPANTYTPPQATYQQPPPPMAAPAAAYSAPLPPYPPQPANYGYPAPSSTGNIDLSSIKPVNSGTVTLEQAIQQAKHYAAEQGVTPYDRPPVAYPPPDAHGSDANAYTRSRSRSPSRREAFRDNLNPFRDERRGDFGVQAQVYPRDRSLSPQRGRSGFSPQGNNGRERSPLRGKEEGSETMQIEATLVGLIIGRQGENLRRVESDSHCRVQFIPATTPNEQYRSCRITGPPARRAEARAAISRIIQDSGMGASPRPAGARDNGRPGASQPEIKDGEATLKIMVPDRTVGLIIGRGGETIRDLQERSQCHINIVGENKSVNGLRPVNLIGSQEAARKAKDLIMEIVDSDSRNVNGQAPTSRPGGRGDNPRDGPPGAGERINDSIYVPSEAVGMIIGKGGETIREMQNNTGCKINVSQSSGPGEVEREIGLVGSRDAINRAKQAIEEKVDAVRQKNSGGGGGGGGGGGRGRGQYRDHDTPSYGQASDMNSTAQGMPPSMDAPGTSAAADPYAAWGGYQAYLALWYQAMAARQGQGQGDANQPPGTS